MDRHHGGLIGRYIVLAIRSDVAYRDHFRAIIATACIRSRNYRLALSEYPELNDGLLVASGVNQVSLDGLGDIVSALCWPWSVLGIA